MRDDALFRSRANSFLNNFEKFSNRRRRNWKRDGGGWRAGGGEMITSPGLLFSPSLLAGFGAATATREEQAAHRAGTNERDVPSGRRESRRMSRAHAQDPRSSPSPRPRQMILLPEISPFRRSSANNRPTIPPLVP